MLSPIQHGFQFSAQEIVLFKGLLYTLTYFCVYVEKDVQSVELDQVFAMQFGSDLRRGLFYTLFCSQRPNSQVGKNSQNFPVLGSALAAWSRTKCAVTQ